MGVTTVHTTKATASKDAGEIVLRKVRDCEVAELRYTPRPVP